MITPPVTPSPSPPGHSGEAADHAPLDATTSITALRLMTLGRLFDQRGVSAQRQGRIGTFGPIRGQEAVAVGSVLALDRATDWIVPSYRELPALVHHGVPLEHYWLFLLLDPRCWDLPREVRVFPIQIELAAQLPHAAGLAWGLKLRGEDGVVAAYFGDGASSEGDFYEATNLAGVMDAPVIFICLNNGWAISTPLSKQTRAVSIADKARAVGIPGVRVDGNDVFEVYRATKEAVDRARSGGGPTLIEAVSYRMDGHNTSDDPSRYSDAASLEEWAGRDPIERLRSWLADRGLWDDVKQGDLESELLEQIDSAFEAALGIASSVDSELLFRHVFERATPRLEQQMQQLRKERSR